MKKIEYRSGYMNSQRLIIHTDSFKKFTDVILAIKNNTDLILRSGTDNIEYMTRSYNHYQDDSHIMIGDGVGNDYFIYSSSSSAIDHNKKCIISYEEFMQTYGIDPIEELLKELDKAEQHLNNQ